MGALRAVIERCGQCEVGGVVGQRHCAVHGSGRSDGRLADKEPLLVELEGRNCPACGRCVTVPFGLDGLAGRGRDTGRGQDTEQDEEETGCRGTHHIHHCKRGRKRTAGTFYAQFVPFSVDVFFLLISLVCSCTRGWHCSAVTIW